jgi:hypothetical protein
VRVEEDAASFVSFCLGPQNSGDTILISAVVPPVPPLGDVVRDAEGDHPGHARHGFSSLPVRSSNKVGVPGLLEEFGSTTYGCGFVSGRFRMEPHTERARYFEDGCEAWIAVLAESLVETLAAEASVARHL